MNKFIELISNTTDATLKRRATTIATSAQIEQENLINTLKAKKVELDLKVATLTDLAPESTDSLRPGGKDWDAKEWVKELQAAKQEQYFLDIQLQIAESTHKEFFTDTEAKKNATK